MTVTAAVPNTPAAVTTLQRSSLAFTDDELATYYGALQRGFDASQAHAIASRDRNQRLRTQFPGLVSTQEAVMLVASLPLEGMCAVPASSDQGINQGVPDRHPGPTPLLPPVNTRIDLTSGP